MSERRVNVHAFLEDAQGGSDAAYDLCGEGQLPTDVGAKLGDILSGDWGLSNARGEVTLRLAITKAADSHSQESASDPHFQKVEGAVIRILDAAGIPASFEHPGCIVVGDWWFGTANELWGASYNPKGGDSDGYVETSVPTTSTDALAIAAAIAATADERRTTEDRYARRIEHERARRLERLRAALQAFKDAAFALDRAWTPAQGEDVRNYPSHWSSFDEELTAILDMEA